MSLGVLSMITQLGVEPLMYRCDERRIFGGVPDLRTTFNVTVRDFKPVMAHRQGVAARHVATVDQCRIVKVTPPKALGLLRQVGAD